jgi:hypothetical protein
MDMDKVKDLCDNMTIQERLEQQTIEEMFVKDDFPDTPEFQETKEQVMSTFVEMQMDSMKRNLLQASEIMLNCKRFVNKKGQPLQMIPKLEPDPALLAQPLYH